MYDDPSSRASIAYAPMCRGVARSRMQHQGSRAGFGMSARGDTNTCTARESIQTIELWPLYCALCKRLYQAGTEGKERKQASRA